MESGYIQNLRMPDVDGERRSSFSLTSQTKQDLLQISDIRTVEDMMLFLTVSASYFVNSEKVTIDKNLFFVKILESYLDNRTNEHIDYIKKHIETYNIITKRYKNILESNGNLNEKRSIWLLLSEIKDNLFNYSTFRKVDVVHGEGAKLQRKYLKHMDDRRKMMSSNFIFPPANNIDGIIKRLDKKLRDSNTSIYKKASYIGAYIFMAHPFEDGNSRSSRILMISYLNSLSKKEFKLFTFMSNFSGELKEENYFSFLNNAVYSRQKEILDKIKLNEKGDVVEYMDMDEYEKIIEDVAGVLEKRLIKIYKSILDNLHNINLFLNIMLRYNNMYTNKNNNIKILFRVFIINLLKNINNSGIEGLQKYIQEYKFSKKFYKQNPGISNDEINQFLSTIRGILPN